MRIPIIQNDVIIRGELEMNLSFVLCAEPQVFAWLFLLFLVCTTRAQRGTSGSMEGTITDVQGGAISGARTPGSQF